jgi:hypothetical protein
MTLSESQLAQEQEQSAVLSGSGLLLSPLQFDAQASLYVSLQDY